MNDTRGQRAFSLISVMVTVAITGIMAVILSTMLTNAARSNVSISQKVDLDAVKMELLQRLSCTQTLPASTCPAAIQLKDTRGKAIATGGKIGAWTVSASCSGSGSDRGLRFAATRSGVDPQTGQPWSTIKRANDLFDGVRLCSGILGDSCPTTHPYARGLDLRGNARCCTAFLTQAKNVGSTAQYCAAGQTLVSPGYACHQPPRPTDNLTFIPATNSAKSAGSGETWRGSPLRQGYSASCHPAGAGDWGIVMWGYCCLQ